MDGQSDILIVIHNELLRNMFGLWAEGAGVNVTYAVDGVEGLSLLESQRPDVVVLDISMPSISGPEICERMRATSDVPIVVLAGVGEADRVEQCTRSGASRIVPKNIGLRDFLALLRNLADSKGGKHLAFSGAL